MKIVITDLDGTLLDHHTYSWEAARQALDLLKERGIPLVLCTSKTRAEVEEWRKRLGNEHPFIVENGGGVYVPTDCFPFVPPESRRRDGYDVLEIGEPYETLVAVLETAAHASGCRVENFSRLTAEQVAELCEMPVQEAIRAKQREYDEPFRVIDGREKDLLAEIARRGKRWTRGGRFHHIHGDFDKGVAFGKLLELYHQVHRSITTIGVGDSLNDVPLLKLVNVPVLIPSPFSEMMHKSLPQARISALPGPEGWNRALLEVIP